MVRLEHIDKSYTLGENKLLVLKDVNLKVEEGEFVSVLGASGSGKSTLMNIVGCMDGFDSGAYFLGEEAVHQKSGGELAALRNQKVGFIFQKYHLIPQYNILQNIIMPLIIRGMSRREAKKLAEDKIRLVGLWDRIGHRPNELSGGQQQRVAIARALVTEPALLLADEPTGALDSVTGKEILGLFRDLNRRGNTIMMITHDQKVASFGSRTITITDGVVEM